MRALALHDLLAVITLFAAQALVSACDASMSGSAEPAAPVHNGASPRAKMGLITSLPLYWPLDRDTGAILAAGAEEPWARSILEKRYSLVPLDTLADSNRHSGGDGHAGTVAIASALASIERLAVIQPAYLTPSDNVALDQWVNDGGRLLLALDPALTGDYDLPLGDPRRPLASALMPPALARWGLAIRFDEAQQPGVRTIEAQGTDLPIELAGQIELSEEARWNCSVFAAGAAARCEIGEGVVTLIADAVLFEKRDLAGVNGERIDAWLQLAFE